MTTGLTHLTAMAAFRSIVQGGSLPSQNPRGAHMKPIRVAFDVSDVGDGDHILFKSASDTHGRAFKGQHRPEDFQQDRADRLGWIPHVLMEPDAIYSDTKAYNDLAYVYSTLDGEEFVILIHERDTPQGSFYFVTGYGMTSVEWEEKKRRRFTRYKPNKARSQGKTGRNKW